jgi:hypothetical protein
LRDWRAWLALLGFAACAAGFILDRTWTAFPERSRWVELAIIALAVLLPALLLRRWPGWRVATTVTACAVLAIAAFAGIPAVLATVLLALAAIGVGSLLAGGGVALVIGLALVAGATGWLLPLPLHRQWVYALVFALVTVLRREAIGATLRGFVAAARREVADAPVAAALAMFALLFASTGCWLPTLQYDDVAYHLGLPYQLQESARYALDPDQQVWALAPWAGDVLQAIVQVLAGAEARGAVDALWLLIAASATHQLARVAGASAWARWAAVGVFATVPMTMALAAGMQTELPGLAVTLVLAWVILNGAGSPLRSAASGGLLFGLLCALKVMHAVTALPLLLWAAVRHRGSIGVRTLSVAALSAAAVGGASYTYAWLVAGNPVLPLQNALFRSPYYRAENFLDARWALGFAPDLPWRMTFDTGGFLEASDGALGFLWVALAGAWLLAVLERRTRGLALAATGGVLLAILPIQYARYAYPSLLLLSVPAIAALDRALRRQVAAPLVLALCLVQLAFVGSGYWILHTQALRQAVLAGGADAPLYAQYVPERALAARMRAAPSPPAGAVLALRTEPDALAELGRRGRTVSWYSHRLVGPALKANRDASGRKWAALIRREGVSDLILRPDRLTPAQRQALVRLGAYRVDAVGDAEWWRVP